MIHDLENPRSLPYNRFNAFSTEDRNTGDLMWLAAKILNVSYVLDKEIELNVIQSYNYI